MRAEHRQSTTRGGRQSEERDIFPYLLLSCRLHPQSSLPFYSLSSPSPKSCRSDLLLPQATMVQYPKSIHILLNSHVENISKEEDMHRMERDRHRSASFCGQIIRYMVVVLELVKTSSNTSMEERCMEQASARGRSRSWRWGQGRVARRPCRSQRHIWLAATWFMEAST
jgi:hypothetical protein